MTTYDVVVVFLVYTWDKINIFWTNHQCSLNLFVAKFQKYQGW